MTTSNIQNETRSAFFLKQEEFQGNIGFQPSTNSTINATQQSSIVVCNQPAPLPGYEDIPSECNNMIDDAMEIDSCCRSITSSGKSVNTDQLIPDPLVPCLIHKIELKFEIYPIGYQTPLLQPRSVMKKIANLNPNIEFYAEQYNEINKYGEVKQTEVKIEAKAKKDPQSFFPEILRSLTTVKNHIVLHAKDLRLFSCELKDSLIFSLSSLMFCNRASDMALRSKWTIDYSKDNHDQKTRLQALFQAQFNFTNPKHLVTINVWNKSPKPEYYTTLDHFAFTCSSKNVKSLIVGLPLKEESIKIVLELSHPMTLKQNYVQITSLENNNPLHSPEYRESTIYRGRNNYDKPAPGVLFGNKFILLEMNATYEQLHLLLSRIFQTTSIEITYSPLEIIHKEHYQKWPQYMQWMDGDKDPFGNEYYKDILWSHHDLTNRDGMILTLRLRALIDLGDHIKDQLLVEKETYKSFLGALFDHISQVGFERAVGVLEAVIRFLGQTNKAETLKIVYNEFKDLEEKGCLPFASPKIELHYEKAESIEITPYGVLVKLPEIHFGNMVSRYIERRKFDDENNPFMPMLRASIRGENGEQLRWTLNRQCTDGNQKGRRVDKNLRKRLQTILEGFQLLGERFVFYAASGSQQKEGGMFLVWEKNLAAIRNAMGDYSGITNFNKLIAREGMATSQSMECPIPITRDMWEVESDIERGKYCFTDGSGRISYELMEEICKVMGTLPCIPAGFQFRFPGFKGMLYYDVNLSGRRIVFRKSQQKHELGTIRTPLFLQIIMFCCPQTANFSANFLNIIDQNSKKQDKTVNDRIVNTCLSMNESFFKRLAEANIDEEKFRMEYLKLPFFFLLEKLPENSGFILHQEEFFLGNLTAYIRKTICKTISKNRVVGDPMNSRSAHGSPDDLGLLPEGCIYFESSRGVNEKFPNPESPSDVWEGKVIVFKYPCQHPGDVQVVRAIKMKEYAGQRDKLIFSAKGHRPIFDMLSGSDNDGDVYVICKLEELMPSDNEVPMDYTAPANKTSSMTKISQQERIKTYLDCAEDDNMGLASICQLVKSDEHGLESVVANNLAKTTVLALDRPKSGLNPPYITRTWTQTEDGEPIPPEFPFRRPDFKSISTISPTYKSTKLNGRIHQLNRQLNFLVETTPKKREIKLNPVFVELYKTYTKKYPEEIKKIEDDVRSCLSNYNKSVLNLMNDYGLDTEAELFSGCHMSGRAFERDEDENSNINSKKISLDLLSKIVQKERENFFNICHTAGYMAATKSAYTPRNGENEEINVLKRNVICLSDLMRKRAICAYIRCYEMAKTGPHLLSFAWVAYDVLAEEMNRFNRTSPDFQVDEESFYIKLETKVQQMKDGNMAKYDELASNSLYEDFVRFPLNKTRELYGKLIDDICFVLVQWGISTNLVHRNSETYSSDVSRLVFLFFAVAGGCIPGLDDIFKTQENSCEPWTLGKLLVEIFARLSSHNFGSMLKIVYDINDSSKYFNKKLIKPIYLAARQTYYYMSINQDLETFDGQLPYYIVKERGSRIIEIPVNCDLNKITEILKEKIKAEQLSLLRKYADSTRVIVMFRGSYETEEKLRQIVEIPPLKGAKSREEEDNYYSTTVLKRILK